MQIEGFNLGAAGATRSVTIGGADGGSLMKNGAYYYINVPASATSGAVIYKADGIEAVNNQNNNANSWNTSQEALAGNESSALWNDDRYAHLFDSHNLESGSNQGHFRNPTVVGSIVKPAMTIDPDGRLWASWSSTMINPNAIDNTNGGGTNSLYTPMYFSHNGGSTAPANARPVSWTMDPPEDTDIAWNTTDGRRSIVYLANYILSNTHYNDGGLAFWDGGTDPETTSTGIKGIPVERFNNLGNQQALQFINPRIAYDKIADITHISYYDAKYRLLRYWNSKRGAAVKLEEPPGIVIEGDRPFAQTFSFSQGVWKTAGEGKQEGYFFRQAKEGEIVKSGTLIGRLRANSDGGSSTYAELSAPFDGTVTYLVENSTVQRDTSVFVLTPTPSPTASDAGNYNAIDVNSAGIPVIVYLLQDKANGTESLKYAYGNAANATSFTTAGIDTTGLSTAGRYVSMRIDKTAGANLNVMHIVFMDSDNGDLVYIKGTPSGGAYTFAPPVVIDSVGNVGKWADIAIGADGNPVISYLDQGGIDSRTGLKMAFYDPALSTATVNDPGTDASGWEYVTLPGRYAVNDVRTQVECDLRDARTWDAAFAYVSDDYYRISYYVRKK
jgi:hypothetical protein